MRAVFFIVFLSAVSALLALSMITPSFVEANNFNDPEPTSRSFLRLGYIPPHARGCVSTWILSNNSDSRPITATIKFTFPLSRGRSGYPPPVFDTIPIAPGEEKRLARLRQRSCYDSPNGARIVGAYFS